MPEEVVTETARSWWLVSQGTLSLAVDIMPLNVFLAYWVLSILLCIGALRRHYANTENEWGDPYFGFFTLTVILFAPIVMPYYIAYIYAVGYRLKS